MSIDEKKNLKDIEESISALEKSLTYEIVGKEISSITKLPFKVISLVHSLHHRAIDLAKNSYQLYINEDYLASAILIRSLMETTALTYLVKKRVLQTVESENIDHIDDFIMNSSFGGKTEDSPLTCPHIMKAVNHTNKKYEKYREMYAWLSEFVHPNWMGTTGLYSKINEFDGVFEGKVSFGKNINSKKPKYILAPFMTGLIILQITFSDFSKAIDNFIRIAEDEID